LAELGLDADMLSALLDLEGLRRQPRRLSAATRSSALVRTVQLTKEVAAVSDRPPQWSEPYRLLELKVPDLSFGSISN
jgi:hypothetical protein